jgi:hypothetical protein
MHDPTAPSLASLPVSAVNTPTEQQSRHTRITLRSRLLLLTLLLLFLSGSVTWLRWPDVVTALSVALSPSPRTRAAHLHSIMPTPTIALSATASTWHTIVADSFGRPNQTYWGQASDGMAWGADANTKTAFTIVNQRGQIRSRQGTHTFEAVIGPAITNAEIDCTLTVVSTMQDANVGVVLHWQNASNWLRASLNHAMLVISQMAHGHLSRLGASPFVVPDGTSVTLRFRAENGMLEAAAWDAGTSEPKSWMLMIRNPSLAASGSGGIVVVLRGANVVTVTRFLEIGASGIGKAHVSGRNEA